MPQNFNQRKPHLTMIFGSYPPGTVYICDFFANSQYMNFKYIQTPKKDFLVIIFSAFMMRKQSSMATTDRSSSSSQSNSNDNIKIEKGAMANMELSSLARNWSNSTSYLHGMKGKQFGHLGKVHGIKGKQFGYLSKGVTRRRRTHYNVFGKLHMILYSRRYDSLALAVIFKWGVIGTKDDRKYYKDLIKSWIQKEQPLIEEKRIFLWHRTRSSRTMKKSIFIINLWKHGMQNYQSLQAIY